MRTPLALLSMLVAVPAAAGSRLDDPVTPTAERVRVLVDPAEDSYTGSVEIDLTIEEKTDRFRLHAQEMDLGAATLRKGKRTWEVAVAPGEGATIEVVAPRAMKPGEYTLALSFENDLNTLGYGLYRFEHGGQRFVVTQFEADDARTAFPCFDEPLFKIPWEITIEAPERMVAVSNMPVATQETAGGWTVTSFAPTPPTSSYLVALAVGPYAAVPVEGIGHVYTPPGTEAYARFLAEETPRSLAWLEAWFGTPYPYPKLDWVIAEHAFGAMENPGMVVAQLEYALLDPATVQPERKAFVSVVIAHELAHMWFGDLVTMAWWDDLWLNESFAHWLALEAVAELWPDHATRAADVISAHGTLREDGHAASQPMRTEVDPTAVMETTNHNWYDRGQGVLTMVQGWIGRAAFQEGVRAYLDQHAWGNATSADLFDALAEASGEDVGAMLLPYLDEPGAPLVRIELEGTQAVLSQRRYQAYGSEVAQGTVWTVPLQLRVGRPDGSVERVDAVLTGAEGTVEVGEAVWVMPTAGGVGYFVWSQPKPALDALVAAAPAHLTEVERVALVGNLTRLMQAGELHAGDLFALLEALRGETSPVVVGALLPFAELMDEIAADGHDEAVASWVRDTFRPALDAIGFEPGEGEPPPAEALRPNLLYVLGHTGGDADVLAFAQQATERFLDDPASVDPTVAFPAAMLAAEAGGPALQERLLAAWRTTADPQLQELYLAAASRVPGEEAQARALALALSDETEIATMYQIVRRVFADEEDKDAGLAWAMANHAAVWEGTPPVWRSYLVIYGSGCSQSRFAKAAAFYGAPDRAVPGTEQRIAEFGEEVAGCVARKSLHGDSVAAFLQERETAAADPE